MQKYFNNVVNRTGDVVVGALVTVTNTATGALASLFVDDGVTPSPNPVVTDNNGFFEFYVDFGRYSLTISGGGVDTLTIPDISLEDSSIEAADAAASAAAAAASAAAAAASVSGFAAPTGSNLVGYTPAGTGAVATTVQAKLRRIRAASDKGAGPSATGSQNTTAIQALIDELHAEGGGVVLLDYAGTYNLAASTLSETYDNFGSPVPASDGCLVMRSGVYLRGVGLGTVLAPASPTLSAIYVVSPESGGIESLSIDSSWVSAGAGHGILGLNDTGGTDAFCRNYRLSHLKIENVGSYGIGLQNGDIQNLVLSNIRTFNTGADGIDLKNRGSLLDNKAIFLENIFVDTFGQRLDGCAGVDVRGVVTANNIQAINVGRTGVSQTGIRFRTAAAASPNQGWAAKSSLSNFYVRGLTEATASTEGVTVGSSDVAVSCGAVDACQVGISFTGNAFAAVLNSSASNVVVRDANTRAFVETTGSTGITYTACHSVDSAIGFRNEGTQTVLIGCTDSGSTTPQSSSGGAGPSLLQIGCNFGGAYLRTTQITSGRVSLEAVGSDADIDIAISPKGTGKIRYGSVVGSADAPVTGYVEIRTSAGTLTKLAVIA